MILQHSGNEAMQNWFERGKDPRCAWILEAPIPCEQWAASLVETLSPFGKHPFVDTWEGDLILLAGVPFLEDVEIWSRLLLARADSLGYGGVVVVSEVNGIEDFEKLFGMQKKWLNTAKQIQPERRIFTKRELDFARECDSMLKDGAQLCSTLGLLAPLRAKGRSCELIQTLTVHLLDGEARAADTAIRMYVHKNTVKYRLRRAGEKLGFEVGQMPGTLLLYRALALNRLMESSEVPASLAAARPAQLGWQ
ncbi:helix-turn-helix domain-containing protein [Gehongia tenuis]|uniref:Helix-turn-helix domain-containing protein n=1 Tax=Gehongia tenuis TaxID=2763655 RepID=A0A926D5Y2_9FIRM|nr:helix-turn-helix domain-containing protein [Gehongia tenuis]MBC8531942.1 helix-turn-helix domain-containing protein [Gehongia tenuis]